MKNKLPVMTHPVTLSEAKGLGTISKRKYLEVPIPGRILQSLHSFRMTKKPGVLRL